MIKNILNKKLFLFALLIILVVSILNASPAGYIVAGGDVFQIFNFPKLFYQHIYIWTDVVGEGVFLQSYSYIIYYFFIYVFSTIFQLSPSAQASLYYIIFLGGSFLSFYCSLVLFSKKNDEKWYTLFSFVYAFNIFTFQNFFSTLGYSPFNFLYVLIPIIFALVYRYFIADKVNFKIISVLGLVFFISNIVNGNLPFFIALILFLFLFIVGIFFQNYGIKKLGSFIYRTFVFALVYFLSVFWSIIPQITEMLRLVNVFATDNVSFGLESWIIWQAVRFPSTFFITYDISSSNSNIILLYAQLALFTVMILSFLLNRKVKALSILFFILLLCSVFLLNKGIGVIPIETISYIFSNPILGSLRSHEKAIIFIPFFLLIIVFLNLDIKKNIHRYLIYLLVLSSVLMTYPMLLGQMQTRYSASFKPGENYTNTEYAYLNKIPEDYFKVSKELNKDVYDNKILRVPYNVINSPNWVNFPQWKHVGSDPTLQLFDNATIQMSQHGAFGKWNYGYIWSRQKDSDSTWILPFAGMLNSKYIIYHKDVDPKFIKQSQSKMQYYEDRKLITKINENKSFDLYRISDQFFLPHIYTVENIITSDEKVDSIPRILSSATTASRSAIFFQSQNINKQTAVPQNGNSTLITEYEKINPTRYRVIFHNVSNSFIFVFSEVFHSGWKAYHVNHKPSNQNDKVLSNYNPNQSEQASKRDVAYFIDKNWISKISEEGTIKFISKNIKGTIQNNNLDNGYLFDVWFKKSIDENYHSAANGYANAWTINPKDLCESSRSDVKCMKNSDGSYDIELVIDFFPQQLYIIGLAISSLTFATCFIYLITTKIRKSKKLK